MRKIGMLTASMACLMAAMPAWAQSEPGLETVIVTARKVAENIQTVPISISAFSQRDLDNLNVKTIEDLKYAAPPSMFSPRLSARTPSTSPSAASATLTPLRAAAIPVWLLIRRPRSTRTASITPAPSA